MMTMTMYTRSQVQCAVVSRAAKATAQQRCCFMRRLQLRFDIYSTVVRLPFDCVTMRTVITTCNKLCSLYCGSHNMCLQVVTWTATHSGHGDLDLWPFDLELVRNGISAVIRSSRGTDNLPANFGASATFRCRVNMLISKHRVNKQTTTFRCLANMHQTDDMTLLPWPLTSPHTSLMQVIVLHPCTKFEVHQSPIRKIWRIFRLSINRHRDLDLWPFDFWTRSRVTRDVLPSCWYPACYVLPFST